MCAWGLKASQMDDGALTAGAHRGSSGSDRAKAVRAVASMSSSAEECVLLLDQVGLDPSEGVSAEPAS